MARADGAATSAKAPWLIRRRWIAATFAVVAASLVVWWYVDTFADGVDEIGGLDLPMTIVVVDAETKNPIAGALVRIRSLGDDTELSQGISEGRTDAGGTVNLEPLLFWTSRMRWNRRHGWIRFSDKGVTVMSVGYEPLNQELEAFAGWGRPLSDTSPLSIKIEMKRAKKH